MNIWAGLGLARRFVPSIVLIHYNSLEPHTNPICSVIFARVVKLRYQMMSTRDLLELLSGRIKELVQYKEETGDAPLMQSIIELT